MCCGKIEINGCQYMTIFSTYGTYEDNNLAKKILIFILWIHNSFVLIWQLHAANCVYVFEIYHSYEANMELVCT